MDPPVDGKRMLVTGGDPNIYPVSITTEFLHFLSLSSGGQYSRPLPWLSTDVDFESHDTKPGTRGFWR